MTLRLNCFGGKKEDLGDNVWSFFSEVFFEEYNLDKLTELIECNPDLVFCFQPTDETLSPLEIAQSLRMNYPDLPIFFIALDKKNFDKKKLIKNGFTQAYLLPIEKDFLLRSIKQLVTYAKLPALKEYTPVKVVDLDPNMNLDFSLKLHLPVNNKLISYANEGEPIGEIKLKKLKDNHLNTLFVHKNESDKFRDYTVRKFREIDKNENGISETERQQKLETCVRDLVSDLFIDDSEENTFAKSGELFGEIKKIINNYITQDQNDLMNKINNMTNEENDFYTHLSNVATYCTVFGFCLGMKNISEVAAAGLLHDTGLTALPPEAIDIPLSQMTPNIKEAYQKHPELSIEITRIKKMILPERVMKAILQHHERINGSGYPKGYAGNRICEEARLLAIADEFDYLTSYKVDEKPLSPKEAIEHLIEVNNVDVSKQLLDIQMLKKIKEVLIGATDV